MMTAQPSTWHRRRLLRQRLRDGRDLVDRLSHRQPVAGKQQGLRRRLQHAFVAKLNAAGSALVYSTYLGGSDMTKATASPWIPPATPT